MQKKLKPAGFTARMLRNFCRLKWTSMLKDSYGFTLKEVKDAGATVKALREEELKSHPSVREGALELRCYNHVMRSAARHKGLPQLKYMADFTAAGYTEAEVLAASGALGIPVFARSADGSNNDVILS